MEATEVYEAVLQALTEHSQKQAEDAAQIATGMIAIPPFEAETEDGEAVRAVGVVTNPATGFLDFITIKTVAGGEILASTEAGLWPVTTKSVPPA